MWYPPIEPREHGILPTLDGHGVYWEWSGNSEGEPVLVVHGGPGARSHPNSRRWFDSRRYRIVQLDQRGCGHSTPYAAIVKNTTTHLVADMESLRCRLGIDRWTLFGRSWGTTVALAYAQAHRDRVVRLVLAGIFTARRSELAWLYGGGAAARHPAAWERLCRHVGAHETRDDLIAAFHGRLTSENGEIVVAAARAWCAWEHTLATGHDTLSEDDRSLVARARIQTHYLANAGFLAEGQIIANADRLAGLPGIVVQGGDDVVTPPTTAEELCARWPGVVLRLIDGAGHESTDPETMRALLDTFDHG